MSAKEGDVVDSVISPSQASSHCPLHLIPQDFCDMMIALQLATTNYGSHNNFNRPKATRPGGGYLLYRTILYLPFYPTMSLVIEICFSPFPFFFFFLFPRSLSLVFRLPPFLPCPLCLRVQS